MYAVKQNACKSARAIVVYSRLRNSGFAIEDSRLSHAAVRDTPRRQKKLAPLHFRKALRILRSAPSLFLTKIKADALILRGKRKERIWSFRPKAEAECSEFRLTTTRGLA